MTDMPTTYETSTATTVTTRSSTQIAPDHNYYKSLPGILKIAECIITLVAFICALIPRWADIGGGWVAFITITAFIICLLFFLFHFLNLFSRIPAPWPLIELIYYCVYIVFLMISGIVAAAQTRLLYRYEGAAASSFFCFVAVILFALDAFLLYRTYQESTMTSTSTSGVTSSRTTTVTSSSYETNETY